MFESFLQEKKYITNVSASTLIWYKQALGWLKTETPTERDLKLIVIKMRESGMKARSVNSYRTAINAYLHWKTGSEQPCSPQCPHPRIPRMKDEQKVLPTFSLSDVSKLLSWKPKSRCNRRLHTMISLLIDTGCRIDEALSLTWENVDLDNLLVTFYGKGRKERIVPISIEMRKRLFKWKGEHKLIFATKDGKKLGRRNMLRDVKLLCKKLGIKAPARSIHSFRHTAAVNYLRRGGSVFHLQKMLGHTDLSMTRRYANLIVDDLQKVHESVSLLSA